MREEIPDICNLLTSENPSLRQVFSPDYQTMREEIPDICNLLTSENPSLG
jgi:hypothetical protein